MNPNCLVARSLVAYTFQLNLCLDVTEEEIAIRKQGASAVRLTLDLLNKVKACLF